MMRLNSHLYYFRPPSNFPYCNYKFDKLVYVTCHASAHAPALFPLFSLLLIIIFVFAYVFAKAAVSRDRDREQRKIQNSTKHGWICFRAPTISRLPLTCIWMPPSPPPSPSVHCLPRHKLTDRRYPKRVSFRISFAPKTHWFCGSRSF